MHAHTSTHTHAQHIYTHIYTHIHRHTCTLIYTESQQTHTYGSDILFPALLVTLVSLSSPACTHLLYSVNNEFNRLAPPSVT